MSDPKRLTVPIDADSKVSALAQTPSEAIACYVLAHGAGAGMDHPFMSSVASRLSEAGIATLRYQFPYMEQGGKRPDRPPVAHAAVRAAVRAAGEVFPGLPIFAGGKSFGGRMTSQAQAIEPLDGVRGLIFLGFPLHEAQKPSSDRAKHLDDVAVPMLFLQGTNDKLAEIELVRALVKGLAPLGRLVEIEDADHSFHVPKRSGRTDDDAMAQMVDATLKWVRGVLGAP
jgi:predicted alpha/beta-hydrolase family hydrolase